MACPAVEIGHVSYHYGKRQALKEVSLVVPERSFFALVGPNGSGKSTLFRILSTLLLPSSGRARVLGLDTVRDARELRHKLGVVFQFPALDKKLTVLENLTCHGRLYGLAGAKLRTQTEKLVERLGLTDRAHSRVETLSGGLRRRVELAKALVHEPHVLILDEPSTGLDPTSRRELWDELRRLRSATGLTVLVTTHLLDEADACDELALLDEGQVVLCGSPGRLKASLGGEVIRVLSSEPTTLAAALDKHYGVRATLLDREVRFAREAGHACIPELFERFGQKIESITIGRPTLEDLFIAKTGKRLEMGAAQ